MTFYFDFIVSYHANDTTAPFETGYTGGGTHLIVTDFGNGDATLSYGESAYQGYFAGKEYVGLTNDGGVVLHDADKNVFQVLVPVGVTNPTGPLVYHADDLLPCFVPGTRIAVPGGERVVESLKIGDQILTARGESVPVKWIGRRRIHSVFAARNSGLPIRFAAGSLGNGLPKRELLVSPDHAMHVEGCLVHAGALVNGRTIVKVTQWDGDIEYLHIETERHDLILAEGAATETYVNSDTRARFDNHAEYAALYPDEHSLAEPMDLPRIAWSRQLPKSIAHRLLALADQLMPASAAA